MRITLKAQLRIIAVLSLSHIAAAVLGEMSSTLYWILDALHAHSYSRFSAILIVGMSVEAIALNILFRQRLCGSGAAGLLALIALSIGTANVVFWIQTIPVYLVLSTLGIAGS